MQILTKLHRNVFWVTIYKNCYKNEFDQPQILAPRGMAYSGKGKRSKSSPQMHSSDELDLFV